MNFFTRNGQKNIQGNIQQWSETVTNSLEISKSKNQILALDGVRAIACLSVITYHINHLSDFSNIWRPYDTLGGILASIFYLGESGVILFFLLSGFLLFLPFAKVLLFENSSWPSISRFYLRRIFRIVPAYYLALSLMILFFHPGLLHHSSWQEVLRLLTFRMEFSDSQQINGVFWTLAVEFQFYLLLPIICWILALLIRRGCTNWRMLKLIGCLLAIMVWGVFTRYYYSVYLPGVSGAYLKGIMLKLKPFIYGEEGKYFEVFAVGMLLSVLYVYTQNTQLTENWQANIRRFSWVAFTAGLLLLPVVSMYHFYHVRNLDFSYANIFNVSDSAIHSLEKTWIMWEALLYAVSYGLCIAALLFGSRKLQYPFEIPILRWVGLISFSLYMWHLPFIFIFLHYVLPSLNSQGIGHAITYLAFYIWALFVIVPISLAFYRWIEMPGIRVGELIVRRFEYFNKKRTSMIVKDNQ
ncbi:acyltransferase [Ktedonobacter robiniae]|uniref:Acyltransferase n=2 Tax=Ktedonobacter robiniae TaxID=2778365 RepID=A0ABQ3ULA2_9CHLR|nr:acyltransferase [Ktedonobacter robiniae]